MSAVVSPIFMLPIVSKCGSGVVTVGVLITESCGNCQSVDFVVVILMELTCCHVGLQAVRNG